MYKKLANKKPKVTTQIVFALHYMYFIQLTKKIIAYPLPLKPNQSLAPQTPYSSLQITKQVEEGIAKYMYIETRHNNHP